jgi:hypothetical protein
MEGISPSWRKSSYSGNGGADCVEVAHHPGRILVRDSKRPGGHVLTFPAGAWHTFITGIRSGDLHPGDTSRLS